MPSALKSAAARTGTAPVPVSATLTRGFDGSLLLIVSAAERAPRNIGAKTTAMEQFAAGIRLAGQLLVCLKSAAFAPVIPMLVTARVTCPALDSVTVSVTP